MSEVELYYRYEESNQHLWLRVYPVIKHTKCGVWLDLGYGVKRFVLSGTRKTFAHPSKELAVKGYIARKKYQIRMLKNSLASAEQYLSWIQDQSQLDFIDKYYTTHSSHLLFGENR